METYYLAHFFAQLREKNKLVKSKYLARRKTETSNERIIHGQPCL